jgi:hypothetical protein
MGLIVVFAVCLALLRVNMMRLCEHMGGCGRKSEEQRSLGINALELQNSKHTQ